MQMASEPIPSADACLSQMRTLTKTVSILFITPTTEYAVAVMSDWHQKPAQLMHSPTQHDTSSHVSLRAGERPPRLSGAARRRRARAAARERCGATRAWWWAMGGGWVEVGGQARDAVRD